eukprot:6328024-Pyramimonas_sp.AAC.1
MGDSNGGDDVDGHGAGDGPAGDGGQPATPGDGMLLEIHMSSVRPPSCRERGPVTCGRSFSEREETRLTCCVASSMICTRPGFGDMGVPGPSRLPRVRGASVVGDTARGAGAPDGDQRQIRLLETFNANRGKQTYETEAGENLRAGGVSPGGRLRGSRC